MRYVVKLLENVNNINDFEIADESVYVRGNAFNLYFQLFKETVDREGNIRYTRYMPQGTPTYVECFFRNFNNDKIVNRVGVPAFAQDTSIYYVPVLATDKFPFNGLLVKVTEAGIRTSFVVLTDLTFQETDDRALFT
jgi:hypothetical protein